MFTAYIKNITAFDATKDQIVSFGYAGNQCIKNRIVVYNSATNASVYDNTVTTFTLAHTIPAGTLTNGASYYCIITAYYLESNIEKSVVTSSSNIFKCLAAPTWAFDGLVDGSVIGNSYYAFKMSYSQTQNETVNEYYIVLYDVSGSVFWTSGALYDITALTTVTDLPQNSVFKVRAYGTTTNGMVIDTRNSDGSDITVTVDYISPTLYSLVEVKNDKWNGWTKESSHFLEIEGTSSGSISYVNNKCVDITASGASVLYTNAFDFKDGTVEARVYNTKLNSPALEFTGTNLSILVTFKQSIFSDGEKYFAELKESNSGYVLYSNKIAVPLSTDVIYIWVQRKDGLFNLKIENMGAMV